MVSALITLGTWAETINEMGTMIEEKTVIKELGSKEKTTKVIEIVHMYISRVEEIVIKELQKVDSTKVRIKE